MEVALLTLLLALAADWIFGEPEAIWSRLPHPVVLFGKAVSFFDKRFNDDSRSDDYRYKAGAVAISMLVLAAILTGLALHAVFGLLGPLGLVLEGFVVFALLAQKSLADHVRAVATGLRQGGLEGGRKAVGMIVGRDPASLDEAGISRAAIETLAENFSDGAVAPAFWYAVFGLPGMLAYKMINTADSMIGYHNARYEHFGKVAAQTDDLANWLPARISAIMIAAGALFWRGTDAAWRSLAVAFKDSGLHRSPNAGWPEAAMAGALNVALGGPRIYPGEAVSQAHLNAGGRMHLGASDIDKALGLFRLACFCEMGAVAVLAILA
jgi:adenosylcobinamide-phosphate synthase